MILTSSLESVASVDSTHDTEYQTDHDDELNDMEYANMQEGLVGFVNAGKESGEEADGSELKRRETDDIENCGANIEIDVVWTVDGG